MDKIMIVKELFYWVISSVALIIIGYIIVIFVFAKKYGKHYFWVYGMGKIYKVPNSEGYRIILDNRRYAAYTIVYNSAWLHPFKLRKKDEIIGDYDSLDQAINKMKQLDKLAKANKPKLFCRLIH